MHKDIFFSVLGSRLGLRFFPMGASEPNVGVENGGEEILKAIAPNLLDAQKAVLEQKFIDPENVSENSYLNSVFDLYSAATERLLEVWPKNKRLVSLGGDHSVAYISLSAVLQRFGAQNVGVLLFDSHGDLHTPKSSNTGNFHGMWLRTFFAGFTEDKLRNELIRPQQLRFVGNVLLEDAEQQFVAEQKIPMYGAADLSRSVVDEIVSWTQTYPHLHISFDIDVFAQRLAPATGTPNENGLTQEEVFRVLEAIKKHPSLSLDIVEFNPKKEGARESLRLIKKVFESFS